MFLVAALISFVLSIPNRVHIVLRYLDVLTKSQSDLFSMLKPLTSLFIWSAISFGMGVIVLRLVAAKPVNMHTLFCGFRRYGKVIGLYITTNLLVALWMLLLIIPGLIKAYAYSMCELILAENPDMGIRAVRRESARIMKGHKRQLFMLHLSFIGWGILSVLTSGIVGIWSVPYQRTATVHFYHSIKDHQSPRGNAAVDEWN